MFLVTIKFGWWRCSHSEIVVFSRSFYFPVSIAVRKSSAGFLNLGCLSIVFVTVCLLKQNVGPQAINAVNVVFEQTCSSRKCKKREQDRVYHNCMIRTNTNLSLKSHGKPVAHGSCMMSRRVKFCDVCRKGVG